MGVEFFAILVWEPFSTIEDTKIAIDALETHPSVAVHSYFVALPFSFLDHLSKEPSSSLLTFGATSMNNVGSGFFTEQIAAPLLKEAQAKFVLLGMHKNRILQEEDDLLIRKKVAAAAESGIIPILCIGETYKEYQEGKSKEVLSKQLAEGLKDCTEKEWGLLQVVYEAPWINETPFLPDLEEINQAYKNCRNLFTELFGQERPAKIPIHCGIPNDTLDLAPVIQKIAADGFYFGQASLNLEALSEGLHLTLATPGEEANAEIVGEAVLAAARETEKIDLTTPLKEPADRDKDKKKENKKRKR